MKFWADYIDDRYNVLWYKSQSDPTHDAEVDTAYLTMYYYFFRAMQRNNQSPVDYAGQVISVGLSNAIKQLEIEPGVWRRHPDTNTRFSNPKTMSRDNILPIVMTLGVYRKPLKLMHLIKRMEERNWFFQNELTNELKKKRLADWAAPSHRGIFLRSKALTEFRKKLSLKDKAKLLFCDFWQTLAVGIQVFKSYMEPNNTASVLGAIAMLSFSVEFYPTALSRFNCWLYSKRKAADGSYEVNSGKPSNYEVSKTNSVQAAADYYCRHEFDPPHNVLTEEITERYF